MKEVISMSYGCSTSSWKTWKWMRLDLIFTSRDIHINCNLDSLTKFSCSSRSTKFKDILPWNISKMIMKTVPISMRIVVSCAVKSGILFWTWRKVNGNWTNCDQNFYDQNFLMERNHCRTKTGVRRKKQIQNSRSARVIISDPSRKGNHLSKMIWDRLTRIG